MSAVLRSKTAIRATFADFRMVRSRKVAQLVMEVPIEEADHALRALGGVPQPHVDRWVGIAPITEDAATRAAESLAGHKAWNQLSCAQQAGIRCNDPEFQAWLKVQDAEGAAAWVRKRCCVDSRSKIDRSVNAISTWRLIDDGFRNRHMGG